MPRIQQLIRRTHSRQRRKRHESRINQRPGIIQQIPLGQRGAKHRRACSRQSLAERVQADGDSVFEAQGADEACSARTEDAGGVGFVDDDGDVVVCGSRVCVVLTMAASGQMSPSML